MKKSLSFMLVLFILLPAINLFSQQTERQLRSDLKNKAIKEARKESKKLKKDGWYVPPGSLTLDKILESAWMKQLMEDDEGHKMYITADGNSVAESKTAGDMQAFEMGKLQLAGLIETRSEEHTSELQSPHDTL
jgi:hypothetical protein